MAQAPIDALSVLYRARFGHDPVRFAPVAAQGSKRRMLRLVGPDDTTAIGVLGPDRDENRAFLSFSKSLRGAGLPVPEILAEGEHGYQYLVEDLGDTTLFAHLEAERAAHPGNPFPDSVRSVYEKVVEALPRLQVLGHQAVDYRDAHPRAVFDRRALKWDLDAFKYMFLRLAGIPFHEDRLEDDCGILVEHLLEAGSDSFVFRDFQSRNIMLRDGEPWFIDYQGGRRGALQYDLASLLYDGKAAIPDDVRVDLLEHYLDAVQEHAKVDRCYFRGHFGAYVLVRILQAMSAYGYLGFYLRKPHFLQSVPHAVRNLASLLKRERVLLALPELRSIFETIVADDRWQPQTSEEAGPLTVHVGSFSYKHGYPADPGGHGGGYVFDCRAVPNPGREERFAGLCGLDASVVEHLTQSPDARAFHGNASSLVRAQVETYRRRGFTSLSVQFGCTGGQHRSVYFAQRLGGEVNAWFPDLRVIVTHREQDRWPATAGLEAASIESAT